MFCYLEQVELKVSQCPVASCIYKSSLGDCAYEKLTDGPELSAQTVAEVRGIKLYKAKSEIAIARERIEIGLMIDRYAEWVRTNYPEDINAQLLRLSTKNEIEAVLLKGVDSKGHPVNKSEDTQIEVTLLNHFRLGVAQRLAFFDNKIFDKWLATSKVNASLEKFVEALRLVSQTP